MSRKTVQSVSSVLLVLVILVVVLLVFGDVGTPQEQTEPQIQLDTQMQPDTPMFERAELATAPRVRVLPSNSTVEPANSSKIGITTINPPSNNRTVGLVIQFWIADISKVNVHLNGQLPRSTIDRRDDEPLSSKRGWTVVRSLEPGEINDENVTIRECSKPGRYLLNADIWFIGDGEWKRRTGIGLLTVENRFDSAEAELGCTVRRVGGNIITCIQNPGQCIVDNEWVVMALGILLSILSLDQFWSLVDRVRSR